MLANEDLTGLPVIGKRKQDNGAINLRKAL
jgi:hypothetical protein